MNNRNIAPQYDFSEFAPNNVPNQNQKYDFSEFSNNNQQPQKTSLDPNILNRVPGAAMNVAKDAWDIAKAIPGGIVNAVKAIPKVDKYLEEQIPLTKSLIKNEPMTAAKYALAGTGDLFGEVSRIPQNFMDYLAKIGMVDSETSANMARTYSKEEHNNMINNFLGEKKPGGDLIRGLVGSIPELYGITRVANVLHPRRYTDKYITKDILKTEKNQIAEHTNMYNDLWKRTEKAGIGNVPFNDNIVNTNLNFIRQYKSPKEYKSVETFMKNPTHNNAQGALSDLRSMQRGLHEKSKASSLSEEETKLLHTLNNTERHIESNMFLKPNGEVNKKLAKRYEYITNSYRENVVPYRYNKDIQEFKDRKLLPKELISRLSRGEFAVKKGSQHPEIRRQEIAKTLLKSAGITGGIGASIAVSNSILNKFLNNKNPKEK